MPFGLLQYRCMQKTKGVDAVMSERTSNMLPLEEHLNRALTELLMLHLLDQREQFIGELHEALIAHGRSETPSQFPYSVFYRLLQAEYILESRKRIAPDGRRRQYYTITDEGRAYLAELLAVYHRFAANVAAILEEGGDQNG